MALNVVTWNIQKGIGADFRRDLARTTRVLAALEADIIGLQEVLRTRESDQAALLAGSLGMTLAWGPAREVRGGTFGNALLVRGDITEQRVHDVSVPRMEPRACLEAVATVDARAVRVFVCHFGLGPRERARQARRLVEIVRDAARRSPLPRVVLGDFNEWRRGPVHDALESELANTAERLATHPSPLPMLALDRMAWDDPLRGQVRVVPVQRASDHRALHTTFH